MTKILLHPASEATLDEIFELLTTIDAGLKFGSVKKRLLEELEISKEEGLDIDFRRKFALKIESCFPVLMTIL